MVSVPNNLNNWKRKVHGLDVEKLTAVLVDFKKVNDIVSKEVVKDTKFSKLDTKVNNLENKIPDACKLI